MRDFQIGIRTYFKSFGFLFSNGLSHYFIYPIVIVVVLTIFFAQGISLVVDEISSMIYTLFDLTPSGEEGIWGNLKAWTANASKYGAMAVLYIFFYYLYLKLNKYLVLILMSPIMALLSEKTEEVITGNVYPFEFKQLVKDVWRGILIALRNMILELGIVALVWLLGLVLGLVFPPIMFIYAPLSSVFLFLVGAYYYGFSTMDYTNERRRMGVGESIEFIRKTKGLAIANGSIFSLMLFVPILGPIVAPITCVCGATLGIAEKIDLSESTFALRKTPDLSQE